MKSVLLLVGWFVTGAAVVILGSWDQPIILLVPVLAIGAIVAAFGLRRSCRDGVSRADLALAVLFYAWLYGVAFLLGVGLLRRVTVPPIVFSFEGAKAHAATTDAFLLWGLVLNAALPAVWIIATWLVERRRRPSGVRRRLGSFGRAAAGAVVIYVAVGLIGAQADAALFGRLPQWEKPRSAHSAPRPSRLPGGRILQ